MRKAGVPWISLTETQTFCYSLHLAKRLAKSILSSTVWTVRQSGRGFTFNQQVLTKHQRRTQSVAGMAGGTQTTRGIARLLSLPICGRQACHKQTTRHDRCPHSLVEVGVAMFYWGGRKPWDRLATLGPTFNKIFLGRNFSSQRKKYKYLKSKQVIACFQTCCHMLCFSELQA